MARNLPKTLHAHVTETEYDFYKALSKKDELPIAAHVRRALRDYLERIEKIEAGEDRRPRRRHRVLSFSIPQTPSMPPSSPSSRYTGARPRTTPRTPTRSRTSRRAPSSSA